MATDSEMTGGPAGQQSRTRISGLHRVLVRPVQEAGRVAIQWETIHQAREDITDYTDTDHHRTTRGSDI